MKIIVSHDVDHLYATEHLCKDLILEKLWVRSFLYFLQGKISVRTFFCRLTLVFHNRMHRIHELMEFDRAHNIPSVFFFGMNNGLGMNYSKKHAKPIIQKVINQGFDVGVHGVDYRSRNEIQTEHDAFFELSGIEKFGIRMHYVRYDEGTFERLNDAGYLFDSTQFDKQMLEISAPYKVGRMWEFPLHIMDAYVCQPGDLEQGLKKTRDIIRRAEEQGVPYCTILFHDTQYDERYDPQMKAWYEETILFCEKQGYEFISYRDAICELERERIG